LRTLFVLVTIVSLWLGWQFRHVQSRKETIKWFAASGASWRKHRTWNKPSQISWMRELMGDVSVQSIHLWRGCSQHDEQRVRAMFPEAEIESPWDGQSGGAF
jgi:hypothetical protein